MYRLFTSVIALAALATAARAEVPPAGAFGRLPATVMAKISPNGQTVAILGGAPSERTLSFSVVDQPGLSVLRLGDVETMRVFWAGDQYAVAQYAIWDKLDARQAYRFVRNVVVTPQAKVASYPLKSDQVSSMLIQHYVIGVTDEAQPKLMIRGLTYAGGGPSHDANTHLGRKGGDGDERIAALLAVDPATGRGVEVDRGDYDVESWEVDLSGKSRVMVEVDDLTTKYRLSARAKGETRWQVVQEGRDDTVDFLGYSDPDDAIYFRKATPAGVQIVRRRLSAAGAGAPEPVGPVAPQGGEPWIMWDTYTNGVLAVGAGLNGGVEWLDKDFGAVYGQLGRAFKGRDVNIASWSRDRTRMIVTVESDDAARAFYLFDRTRKSLSPIGDAYPELGGKTFGHTTRLSYKARDGLDIPAFLTMPAEIAPAAKVPLIVLPHGGPADRDPELTFDYLVQFLASRGYAVLRPQYRGSSGFGPALQKAGEGEWGGKIQTDLVDGIAAAAATAPIDASRVCIVGDTTFGGFSALSGAVFRAPAYRCAVSIGGVPDLGLLIGDSLKNYGDTSKSFRLLRKSVLEGGGGAAAISPLRNAAGAAVPILLVHGEADTSVPIEHAHKMADALTKAGKPVELVVLADEGHFLARSASRTRTLEAVDAFLAKNLGPAGH